MKSLNPPKPYKIKINASNIDAFYGAVMSRRAYLQKNWPARVNEIAWLEIQEAKALKFLSDNYYKNF